MRTKRMGRASAIAVLAASLLAGTGLGAEEGAEDGAQEGLRPVGRVVSLRGAVFAQTPGEERRVLQCRDTIFAGDEILTQDDSAVGVDSGSFYARLGEKSTMDFGATAEGVPALDLERGHLRVLDSARGDTVDASISTPGLQVARADTDTEALVIGEKAGVVSMVCTYERGADVERRSPPAVGAGPPATPEALGAPPGGCVVEKPREPLYIADASHPRLAVISDDGCAARADLPVALLSPLSVELGPAILGGEPPLPDLDPSVLGSLGIVQPCTVSCGSPAPLGGGGGLPTGFVFLPPVPTGGGAAP